MSKKKTQETPVTMPEKVYNFCSKKKMILGILIAVAVVLVAGIIIRGVHLAIEFKGGTLITYTYQGDINTNDVETAVKEVINTSIVVRTGESLDTGGKQLTISFTSEEGLTADRQTELNDAVFGIVPNEGVMHAAVVNYLANQRQGTQSTLTRTEVSGGGRKPWRQKGTGHARQARDGGICFVLRRRNSQISFISP